MNDCLEPEFGPTGGAGDSGAFERLCLQAKDRTAENLDIPRALLDGEGVVDRSIGQARAYLSGLVDEWMRQQTEREEAVAKAAAAMGCGYAVIEETLPAQFDQRDDSYTMTLVYHYVLSPWIPAGERLAVPGWEAWAAWQGRRS